MVEMVTNHNPCKQAAGRDQLHHG